MAGGYDVATLLVVKMKLKYGERGISSTVRKPKELCEEFCNPN